MPLVVGQTAERTFTTPNATMWGLAAPSSGARELSTWRVRAEQGKGGPPHTVDREQVWMPVEGAFEVTADGVVERFGPGQAAIVPAGVERRVVAVDGPAEALVAMASGAVVRVAGQDGPFPLRWAE